MGTSSIEHPSQIAPIEERLCQQIEDELYLSENAKALGAQAQEEFEAIDSVVEDLG